jgi:hypothetical protein
VFWLEAIGGILLLVANVLVIRAVMAAEGSAVAPVVRKRPGKPADLRRAA